MLDTLLKIGEWKRQGASDWDRFLDKPRIATEDKKGNAIKNYILPIIFDLDDVNVVVDAGNLKEYDAEKDVFDFMNLKTLGGNNKAIYVTAPFKKLNQIYKTFFGKENNFNACEGELSEAINKDFPQYKDSLLYQILKEIFLIKDNFLKLSVDPSTNQISNQQFVNHLNLTNNENIVLFYSCVKSEEKGIKISKPFVEFDDYISLLRKKLIESSKNKNTESANSSLCYASGNLEMNVRRIELINKYSLNKMFVTTTKNFASQFDENKFKINYQVSKINQERLDFGSAYLLKNYKIKIAGIDHVIIPQFMSNENLDYSSILDKIKKQSDILFSFATLENMAKNLETETSQIFWINFVAYESDGNFFKSTEIIKDVSDFHFVSVIKSFQEVDWELRDSLYVNWNSVMTEYGKEGRLFNLNSIYNLIPIRKDKEKKNKALTLFKSILENRKIDLSLLYKYFSELILCHYFERYKSYTNIHISSKDYFKKTVRDCVFKYLAFIKVLRKLNLIRMESENQINLPNETEGNKYEKAIQSFFDKMVLTRQQKAMFYLGRMVNSVAYIQKDKNKTVIDKINYNGMDRDNIVRLRINLFEKAKQYGESRKIIFSDAKFADNFDFETWKMDPNEALFFILTGMSFGANSTSSTTEEKTNSEN